MVRSNSTQKLKQKASAKETSAKKQSGSIDKNKNKFGATKACYFSSNNINLFNFIRFPTEACDNQNKAK